MKKIIITIISFILLFSLKAVSEKLEPTEDETLVKFIVTDHDEVPEEGAAVNVTHKKNRSVIKGVTDIDGDFSILLPKGNSYEIVVNKFGKTFDFGDLTLPVDNKRIISKQLLKIRVVTNYIRIARLDNVYFDSNKWDLLARSFKALDKLFKKLDDNKKMVVEIAGHTDSVGEDKFNMRLSQRRANSVRDYLINKGISQDRLISKGYGETSPVTTNKTEVGRQRNRRVEIRVISE